MREAISVGREAAQALAEMKWWEGKTDREIAEFQMMTNELCIPFARFHEAMEKALNRPIFTHEFAFPGLRDELFGDKPAPTFQEILDLIPEDKRIVVMK